MVGVLAAGIAELRHLQTPGGRLLVLGRRIVPVLTCRTLQCDDLAHWLYFLSVWPATSAGKQLASELRLLLTRRNAGLKAPAALNPEIVMQEDGAVRPRSPVLLSTKARVSAKNPTNMLLE